MGKKKAERISLDGSGGEEGGGRLTHNPFAALKAAGGSAPTAPASETPTGASDAPTSGSPGANPHDDPAQMDLRGAPLVVRHERKGHGGKTVTVIDGSRAVAPAAAADWNSFAKGLRKALGVGARAEGAEIILQGDLVTRVADLLEERYGAKVTRGTHR